LYALFVDLDSSEVYAKIFGTGWKEVIVSGKSGTDILWDEGK
jgi:hypothetical protein